MHRRQPGSEFPNDNHALHAGAVWVCHEPTSFPAAVAAAPDYEELFGSFAFEDATHAYDLPPVIGAVPALPLIEPAPARQRVRDDFVVFYPPPEDLWKRELEAASEGDATRVGEVAPRVAVASEDEPVVEESVALPAFAVAEELRVEPTVEGSGSGTAIDFVGAGAVPEVVSVDLGEPAIFGFLEELDALREAVRAATEEMDATPTHFGALQEVLDEAFSESAEEVLSAPAPRFSPVVSLGMLAELAKAPVISKVTVAQSWLPPAPHSEIRALRPKRENVDVARLPSLDVLELELTPVPGAAALETFVSADAHKAPEPMSLPDEPGAPREVASDAPRAATVRDVAPDAFAQLSSALAVVAMSHGATKAAASVPRLLAGERLTESDLPERTVEALVRAGFVEHRKPFVVPTDAFLNTAGAWRQLLRGELRDFSACGDDTLDGWSSRLLAALLATEPGAVRKDLRKAGVAAFGMKRAA